MYNISAETRNKEMESNWLLAVAAMSKLVVQKINYHPSRVRSRCARVVYLLQWSKLCPFHSSGLRAFSLICTTTATTTTPSYLYIRTRAIPPSSWIEFVAGLVGTLPSERISCVSGAQTESHCCSSKLHAIMIIYSCQQPYYPTRSIRTYIKAHERMRERERDTYLYYYSLALAIPLRTQQGYKQQVKSVCNVVWSEGGKAACCFFYFFSWSSCVCMYYNFGTFFDFWSDIRERFLYCNST